MTSLTYSDDDDGDDDGDYNGDNAIGDKNENRDDETW